MPRLLELAGRKNLANLFRYLVVGGIAAVVDLSIFALFALWLEFNYLLVAGLGFITATAVNYQLCIRFIYSSGVRFTGREEVVSVYVVSGIGLLLHEIAIYLIHENLLIPLFWSKVLAIGATFIWNFGMRNFYVFAAPRISGKAD